MENTLENKKIEITQESLGYLEITRKWTMFFAILGFVFIGIMLLVGILAGSLLTSFTSKMPGMGGMDGSAAGGIASVMVFIFILIFSVLYFFPLLYLLRFSKHTKKAVANSDANELQMALKSQKSYWRYLGIFTIIILAFYLLVMIIAGGSLALFSGLHG